MYTTSPGAAAPPPSCWPTSFRGVGFVVLMASNGTYEALAQGGYHHTGFVSAQAALAAVTDWIIAHTQGGQ